MDEVLGHDAELLLEHLATIAVQLSDAATLQDTLQRIVDLGEDLIDGCDGVSLMLVGTGGIIDTPAASSAAARASDWAQYETGEGPCLDAIRHERAVMIEDLGTDDRWPDYRRRALELGVRAMLSFRLFVTDDSMGALDMYSRTPFAFGRRELLMGQVFAAQASAAMKAALVKAGLEAAIASRDVIGQAKGIVMARSHVTADMAFELLRHLSQHQNRRLTDVAQEIARSGLVPRDSR